MFFLPLLMSSSAMTPPPPRPTDIPQMVVQVDVEALKKENERLKALLGENKGCSELPGKVVPGIRVERYNRGARVGGLKADSPLGFANIPALPVKLSYPTSAPASTALTGTFVRSLYRVCEEGEHSFAFLVENPKQSILCDMFVDVGDQRFFSKDKVNIQVEDRIRQFSGPNIRLDKGLHEIKIWMDCAARQFAGFSNATVIYDFNTAGLGETAFTLKVRPPGEQSLRDFKRGELYRPL